MKKIYISLLLVIVFISAIIIYYINDKKSSIDANIIYLNIYEANSLTANIVYDIDTSWNYFLTDEQFNKNELIKKISLKLEEMTDESCKLINEKKISIILDCITISHDKNFKEAKNKLTQVNKYLKDIKNNSNYVDLKNLYEISYDYLNITNYHGDDYKIYKSKITDLKKKIDKLESKLNKVYSIKTSTTL